MRLLYYPFAVLATASLVLAEPIPGDKKNKIYYSVGDFEKISGKDDLFRFKVTRIKDGAKEDCLGQQFAGTSTELVLNGYCPDNTYTFAIPRKGNVAQLDVPKKSSKVDRYEVQLEGPAMKKIADLMKAKRLDFSAKPKTEKPRGNSATGYKELESETQGPGLPLTGEYR